MTTRCSNCGALPREGARFCDACGSAVAASPRSPEFKQVTVLFADVVRSMDIATVLGTERLREVMSELLERSRAVVDRYAGTVDFTGDGIMAIFGAPIALEDHAFRGCLAALELQSQIRSFADELRESDGIDLRLRVGLNSGEVIAGEIGSVPGSYTAIGVHVGMAQRMESIAPPGGVMLSASTAHLVETVVEMGDIEQARIKNVAEPVAARRLLSVKLRHPAAHSHSTLVGRDDEFETLTAHLDDAVNGTGSVVAIVGSPGIGKTRLVAELIAHGAALGAVISTTYCEAHAREIPFHVAARLFRDVIGVSDSQGRVARDRVRTSLPNVDREDLLLLDDLLGIGDPDVEPPAIAPDARRRRLLAMLKTLSAGRAAPALYVVEDAHWIDAPSESLIADFLATIGDSHSLAVITYRPEYEGELKKLAGHHISPAPLTAAQSTMLLGELLGPDPSVAALGSQIAERAAGNPFFAEEIVRDFAERGLLHGTPGQYVARGKATDVHVPATLYATIGARIDRLGADAKGTLMAAAVIGARFSENQLSCLVDRVCVAELMTAELIDAVTSVTGEEYMFRHPLIRSVAYESQLQSVRGQLHRRFARALQDRASDSLEESAALIAMHVEAAGDLRAAFRWHMRAGAWASERNIFAARASWKRASQVANRLPVDDPDRLDLRVEASTLLCGSAWRAGLSIDEIGFDEHRRLCEQAGDERSFAFGMSGMVMSLAFHSRAREASELASHLTTLLSRIDDAELTTAALFSALAAKWETGEVVELLRLAQLLIDLTDEHPDSGNLLIAAPQVLALALRGLAHMSLGHRGWRKDLDRAIVLAADLDPLTRIVAYLHKYAQIGLGALRAGDQARRETAEALAVAEQCGDDFMLSHAHLARGIALIAQRGSDREIGFEHLARAHGAAMTGQGNASIMHIADIQFARRHCEQGELDEAIALTERVSTHLFDTGSMLWRGPATTVLVEALLTRNLEGDLTSARAAMARLAAVSTDSGYVLHDVPLLRLEALVARAEGDDAAFRRYADQYLTMAERCELEGHRAVAAAMV